jgi:hypothetical protein
MMLESDQSGFGQALAVSDANNDGVDDLWVADDLGGLSLYLGMETDPSWTDAVPAVSRPTHISISANKNSLLVGIPNYNEGHGAIYWTQAEPDE